MITRLIAMACRVLAPACPTKGPFPKVCTMCRRVHATREAWSRLQWVGFGDDGMGGLYAMRNCICNTSLIVPAIHDEASTRAA